MEKKFILALLIFALFPGHLFSQTNVQVKKYAVVIKDANIRNMPSVLGEIIYLARAGEKLEVLDDLGIWLKVKIPGGFRFIRSNSVNIEQVRIITPPSPAVTPKTRGPSWAGPWKRNFL